MLKKTLKKLKSFSDSWVGSLILVLVFINFVFQSSIVPSSSMFPTLKVGDFIIVNKFKYGLNIPFLPWVEIPLLPDFNNDGHILAKEGPKRGDIVVFRAPHDPKTHYVKRCVAKDGDMLFIENKDLYIHFSEGDQYILEHFSNYEIYKDSKIGFFVKNPYSKTHTITHKPEVNIETYKNLVKENIVMEDQVGFSQKKLDLYYNTINYPNTKNLMNGVEIVEGDGRLIAKVPKNKYFMLGDNRENSYDSRFWGSLDYRYIEGSVSLLWFSADKDKLRIRFERMFSFPN